VSREEKARSVWYLERVVFRRLWKDAAGSKQILKCLKRVNIKVFVLDIDNIEKVGVQVQLQIAGCRVLLYMSFHSGGCFCLRISP